MFFIISILLFFDIKSEDKFSRTLQIIRECIPLSFFKSNPYTIYSAFEYGNTHYNCIYNINNPFTVISHLPGFYNKTFNLTIQKNLDILDNINTIFNKDKLTNIEIDTTIQDIQNQNIDHFHILSTIKINDEPHKKKDQDYFSFVDGIIGLCPIPDNNTELQKYSYLYHLKYLQSISYLSFGHIYTSVHNIKVFFGTPPNMKLNNFVNRNSSLDFWSLPLKEIQIMSTYNKKQEIIDSLTVNNEIIIDPNVDGILAPYEEGWKIYTQLQSLNDNGCFTYVSLKILYCACVTKPKDDLIPNIVFNLDNDKKIELLGKDIFRYSQIEYEKYVWKSKLLLTNESIYWIIGNSVLKNYDFLFDEEHGKIWIDKNCNYYLKDEGIEAVNCFDSFVNSINYLVNSSPLNIRPRLTIIRFSFFIKRCIIIFYVQYIFLLFGVILNVNIYFSYKDQQHNAKM